MKMLVLALVTLSACDSHFITTTFGPDIPTTVAPATPVAVTTDRANQLAIGNICAAVFRTRGTLEHEARMAELRGQADFTPVEFDFIAKGEVAIGMTQRAGICVLGGNAMKVAYVKNTTTPGHFVEEMTFKGNPPVTLVTDNYGVTGECN